MATARMLRPLGGLLAVAGLLIIGGVGSQTEAQSDGPAMLHPRLGVRPVVAGLTQPTSMAFLGANDMLVLEKNTGQVQRVVNGAVQGTRARPGGQLRSERGLLGIALHPDFPANPGVYLYWTESTTGADTNVLSETPLLGNRVDRFVWNGSALTLRPQPDQAARHPGGCRPAASAATTTAACSPSAPTASSSSSSATWAGAASCRTCPVARRRRARTTVPDDQFGGPQPDNAHLTGVVLRLNDDGTAPSDNPFFAAGAAMGGEVGANIQKIFSYGHRNSFGMAVDPQSGGLWLQENGDDTFSELNRSSRASTAAGSRSPGRWSASPSSRRSRRRSAARICSSCAGRRPTSPTRRPRRVARLFMLPGAHYSDPEFSWKWEVAPGGIGFVDGQALGRSSTATCSWAPPRRTWRAATCSAST